MNNTSLELYTRTDELRVRHAAFLQNYLGKDIVPFESAFNIAARTLICDALQEETIIPDYKSLKKLLKENRRTLKGTRNKVMAAAMRNGILDLPSKSTTFSGKTDLEILAIIDEESTAILAAYDNLIVSVKSAI